MITTPPHLNVPEPGENCLFYFHAAEFLFPQGGRAAFASADVCIGVFRQWITKCQSKTENEAAKSPQSLSPAYRRCVAKVIRSAEQASAFQGVGPSDCSAPCCCPWMELQIRCKLACGYVVCKAKKKGFSINGTSGESSNYKGAAATLHVALL